MRIVVIDRLTLGNDLDIKKASSLGEVVSYDITPEDKVEERIYPQLYEILLYNENSSHEELTSGAQTALSTYYTNLSKEFASTYLTYICQYIEVLELVEAKDANLGSLNVELVKKLINLNIKSWYENNFTIIEAEDDIHSVLLEGLKEEGGK